MALCSKKLTYDFDFSSLIEMPPLFAYKPCYVFILLRITAKYGQGKSHMDDFDLMYLCEDRVPWVLDICRIYWENMVFLSCFMCFEIFEGICWFLGVRLDLMKELDYS